MIDLTNTKIHVKSEEESRRVQEYAFSKGYGWSIDGKIVQHTQDPYLYFYSNSITAGITRSTFETHEHKEIKFTDIFPEETTKEEWIPQVGEWVVKLPGYSSKGGLGNPSYAGAGFDKLPNIFQIHELETHSYKEQDRYIIWNNGNGVYSNGVRKALSHEIPKGNTIVEKQSYDAGDGFHMKDIPSYLTKKEGLIFFKPKKKRERTVFNKNEYNRNPLNRKLIIKSRKTKV